MFCTKCGTQAQQEDRFCAKCGTSLTQPVSSPAIPSAEPVRETPPVPTSAPAPAALVSGAVERKSPAAALLLSLLVPGLGMAYAGDWKQGLWQFASVVGAYFFLWRSVAIFMYLFFAVVALVVAQRANNRIGA